jgi:hypothetical protein
MLSKNMLTIIFTPEKSSPEKKAVQIDSLHVSKFVTDLSLRTEILGFCVTASTQSECTLSDNRSTLGYAM